MADSLLVLNAGSSSLKFSVYEAQGLGLLLRGQVEGIATPHPRFQAKDARGSEVVARTWGQEGEAFGHAEALAHLVDFLRAQPAAGRVVAAGHRVVHGGLEFSRPVRVTPEVAKRLAKLNPLAPLHQPHNLKAIALLETLWPGLPQVACFDTAFHRDQPEMAQAFALPRYITHMGVRRYGFHGVSYEYIASVLPRHDPRAAAGRTVVAHLGNGSSMCAMVGGRSVASTMGFTAVDGLPMGTRSGNLDPGVLLYLMDTLGMDARTLEDLLYRKSGLLGVSGISGDMRHLLASEEPRAKLAIDLYVYRLGRELGSLAAAMGGLDALVFTAGIGENAAPIREAACHAARWLGVELDAAANAAGGPRISTSDSPVSVWVIPTDEEGMIARHTVAVLADAG